MLRKLEVMQWDCPLVFSFLPVLCPSLCPQTIVLRTVVQKYMQVDEGRIIPEVAKW